MAAFGSTIGVSTQPITFTTLQPWDGRGADWLAGYRDYQFYSYLSSLYYQNSMSDSRVKLLSIKTTTPTQLKCPVFSHLYSIIQNLSKIVINGTIRK